MRKPALQMLIAACLAAAGLAVHAQNNGSPPAQDNGNPPPAQNNAGNGTTAALAALVTAPSPAPDRTDYVNRIRETIRHNIVWQGPPGSFETELSVRCAPDGSVTDFAIARPSANPQWDAAVLSAVQKSSPLPVDADGKAPPEFLITFRHEGSVR